MSRAADTALMKSILFADDNINIRAFCKQELEAEGYRVLLASDGEEAARLLHYASIDLAILDIGMPIVGGVEAGRRIKSIAPDIPIIFFTANGRHRMPNRWSELAFACLEKSNDLSELKRLCASVLQPQGSRSSEAGTVETTVGLPSSFDLMEGGQNVNPHVPSH